MQERNDTYDVHGVGVRCLSESQPVAMAIDRRLGSFASNTSAARTDITLTVRFGNPEGDPRLRDGRFVYEGSGAPVVYHQPSDTLLLDEPGHATATVEATEGRVSVWLADDRPETVWLVSHGITTIALIECLKRRGRYVVHAAAVADSNGAIVIPASSGGGKTTLTLALVQAGFAFMSDDLVLLGDDDGCREIFAFPDELDLCDDAAARLPWLAPRLTTPRPAGYPKRPLNINQAVPGARSVMRSPARLIVLPTIVACDESRITPAAADSALHAMLPSLLLTDPASSQRHASALSRLCRSTATVDLSVGPDPAAAATLIAQV